MGDQYYSGRVHSVIFENASQDFYILRMVLDKQEDDALDMFDAGHTTRSVAVKGNVPGIAVGIGTWFGFEAGWKNDPKHGQQLHISKAPVIRGDWTPETAASMLAAQGVGAQVCSRLVLHFREDFVEVLDSNDPDRLVEAPGMTPFTAEHILARWRMVKAYFKTLEFLADAKVPKSKISLVWATFGDDAEEILSTNPWALVRIDGIRFEQADEVARKLGLDMGSPQRVQGAVLYACKSRRGMGHLYLSSGDMVSAIAEMVPGTSNREIALSLAKLHKDKQLILDRSTRPGTTAIYEPWIYYLESQSAIHLQARTETADLRRPVEIITPDDPLEKALEALAQVPYLKALSGVGAQAMKAYTENPDDLMGVARAALQDWTLGSQIELAEHQLEGALNALVMPVSILTGLPGTGKTTTLKAVVAVLKDAEVPFLLCAPTGIAAKRMSSLTGAEAMTIHRAFGAKGWDTEEKRKATYIGVVGDSQGPDLADGSGESWEYGPDHPHPAQVVIVDESSMVDQHLLYRLVTCTSSRCRLVFVGDAAQLPSVGPGNVLRDLLATSLFPTVSLTEIFRQEESSGIVLAAHATHHGLIPSYGKDRKSDFVLAEVKSEDSILEFLVDLADRLYQQRRNFQVLSPRHKGTLGVTNLNHRLRTVLNPKQAGLQEHRLGSETIREDDRIMVVKNNYDKGIFNGDVGKVARIDRKAREIEIKVHGPPVSYVRLSFKDAPKYLRLAYCMTVHKCVHPDTIVETSEGLLPIRAIGDRGEIGTPEGARPYLHKTANPEAPAVRVTTRGGYTLTTTPNHGIDVWDGERYVRREVGELRLGDLLRLRFGVMLDPVILPPLPGTPPHDVRADEYRLPTLMDADLAEFLGLMVADGTVYQRGFRLAKRHEDTVEQFSVLCRRLFRAKANRYFKNGAYHAEVNSTFLSAWLSSIGGLDPHAKAVPESVLRSHSHLQARFLRGLFADGSVDVKGGCVDHIEWTCKFDTLPDIVRTMLLRFGIPCGTVRDRGIHTLYIYGNYARRFGETIGFPSEAKQDRLLLPCGNQTKYFVPVSKSEARALRQEHLDVLGHSACGNAVQRGRLSLHKAGLLLDSGAESKVVRILRERLRFHHEPVTVLETTSCPSMCVEVPDGHRFLQNGFSAWNSQGQEYDVIVMPVAKSFGRQLQRNLFYTAITRARKKVILVGHAEAVVTSVMNNRPDVRNTLFPERLGDAFLEAEGGMAVQQTG